MRLARLAQRGAVGWRVRQGGEGSAFPQVESVVASTTGGASTSITVPLPSGLTSGDIILLTAKMSGAITWPSGFTEIAQDELPYSAIRHGMAWKAYDGTEADPLTITCSGSSAGHNAHAIRISGADTTSPVDVFAIDDNGTTRQLTHTAASLTTTVDNTLILHLFTLNDTNADWTSWDGDDVSVSIAGTVYHPTIVVSQELATAGNAAAITATNDQSTNRADTMSVAIKPAA